VLVVVAIAHFPADFDRDLRVPLLTFVRHVFADLFVAVRHPVTPHFVLVHVGFRALALFSIVHDKISDSVSFFTNRRLSQTMGSINQPAFQVCGSLSGLIYIFIYLSGFINTATFAGVGRLAPMLSACDSPVGAFLLRLASNKRGSANGRTGHPGDLHRLRLTLVLSQHRAC
jgi:hypothetical protein